MNTAGIASGFVVAVFASSVLRPCRAVTVNLPTLAPVPAHADTEETVDYPFRAFDGTRYLESVEAGFCAGEDSCFSLSFGVDADGDGKLALHERRLEVGYDCGKWFLRTGEEAIWRTAGRPPERLYIDMRFGVERDGALAALSVCSGDERVGLDGDATSRLDFGEWNICRVTGRGHLRPEETVRFGFLDFPSDAADVLHLPGERPLFTNDELAARFGYGETTAGDGGGLSYTRMLEVESGAQTNTYAVKFARWSMRTPEFRRFASSEMVFRALLGPSLAAEALGCNGEPPQEGFVPDGGRTFTHRPCSPYRAFAELVVERALSPARIGTVTGSAHFESAAAADAEAIAIAGDVCGRFGLVPEVAVPGRVWLMQTPRVLCLLVRSNVNGEEAVALTLHDKQAQSMYVSLSAPEQFAEED